MELQTTDEIKPKVRPLSRFLCQEMLYDYVNGSLDKARQEAVESFIPTCRDTMRELERLRKGLEYTRALGKLEVPPRLIQSMSTYEPAWQKTLRALTMWSADKGWRYVAPVFIFATLFIGLLTWAPWENYSLNELARVEKSQAPMTLPPDAVVAAPQVTAPAEKPEPVPDVPVIEVTEPPKPKPNMGIVYRSTFEVKELPLRAEEIRQRALQMEGELRPKGDTIIDISLPESKLEEFEGYLATFGPVRLNKDKRPQEMPVGRIRIILVLKETQEVKEAIPDEVPTAPTETP